MSIVTRRSIPCPAGVGILAAALLWPGCGDSANTPTGLRVEVARILPGRFFTIEHAGIVSGRPVQVRFTGPGGFNLTYEAHNTEAGRVRVAAPPVVDLQAGAFTHGDVTISLVGLSGEAVLTIEELPDTQGAPPGLALRTMLEEGLIEQNGFLGKVAYINQTQGYAVDDDVLQGTIIEAGDAIRAVIAEYDATGQMTLHNTDGTTTILAGAALEAADRWVLAIITGLAEEAERAAGRSLRPFVVRDDGDEVHPIVRMIHEAVDKVREGLKTGFSGGTSAAAVMGMTIAVVGLVIEAPIVTFVGAVCVVGGAICSFGNGALGGANSDSFLNNDGESFSFSLETFSQAFRYLSNAVTAIPGVPGLLATASSIATSGWDFFNSSREVKCVSENQQQQRVLTTWEEERHRFCVTSSPDYVPPDNANDNVGNDNNANDNNANDNTGGANGNDNGGAIPSGNLAGCWETHFSAPGQAIDGLRGVLQIDAARNVERGWAWNVWENVWEESTRYTVPYPPWFASIHGPQAQSITQNAAGRFTILTSATVNAISDRADTPECDVNWSAFGTSRFEYSDIALDATGASWAGAFAFSVQTTDADDPDFNTDLDYSGAVTATATTCPPPTAISLETQGDSCWDN